ncbi:bacillithiol biosynthesis deacetylase BshB1 [Flavobacteriales bacterium]|jgi:bacillithiol biosynthesis deacetylase BshB1|nr:bacillithiol biosynthesis deacetylase BshB1 [Crocinitomicaceae bacterium]MDA7743125.1 bacillithiol biosynthesis deacetylase BshB1 [Flavobacteriales bacterium]
MENQDSIFDLCAFGAHPDDVELFAGGTIAKSVAQGKHVALVDLTRGELGSRGTGETRAIESAAAQKVLGIQHRENLDLGDGFFEVNETSLNAVVEVLRRLRPKIVLANALEDRHPDHGRGAELVHRAAFLSGLVKIVTCDSVTGKMQLPWRPQAVYHGIQDRWRKPSIVFDISGFEEVKAQAIAAYVTQFYQPEEAAETPQTPISTPEFLMHLKARDVAMGRLVGVKSGEGFEVKRPPVVDDLGMLG